MKMKCNNWVLSICFVLLAVSVLASCSDKTSDETDVNGSALPITATLVSGSPNAVWSMVSSGISECINRTYPGSVITIVPGSGAANVIRINSGDVNAGMAHNVMLSAAMKGEPPYDAKMTNLAAVAKLYPSHFQIVVKKDLGIQSFDEIIQGKMKIRLSIDQPGSTASVAFSRILGTYGLSEKDIESWGGQIVLKGMEDSASMLSDGLIDGFAVMTLYPANAIQETAVNKDLVMLSFDAQNLKKMIDLYGYQEAIVPKNAYAFLTENIETISANTVLTVPADATDELAYKMSRSIVENLDYLGQVHVALKGLDPAAMTMDTGVPLHPGAKKFYQEIGLLKEK